MNELNKKFETLLACKDFDRTKLAKAINLLKEKQ